MSGAIMPVIPSGTHSVTHQTTIHNIVPRANCGANVGRELSIAAFAILVGTGIKIVATNSKGPTISPIFSFLENPTFTLVISRQKPYPLSSCHYILS
jgi:hypothetical protein